jgi:hypothetical protein
LPVREEHRVHALLQARAVSHQVQPPACALALGTDARIGQPDRWHEVATCQLGQHPGVDAVGLTRQRCQTFYFLRIGDLDLPAPELEPVVHKARPVHRLDRRVDRRLVSSDALAQSAQPVSVRRSGTDVDRLTITVEQMEVETLAAEIQTGVQHRSGPPLVRSQSTSWSVSLGEALLHGIPEV